MKFVVPRLKFVVLRLLFRLNDDEPRSNDDEEPRLKEDAEPRLNDDAEPRLNELPPRVPLLKVRPLCNALPRPERPVARPGRRLNELPRPDSEPPGRE